MAAYINQVKLPRYPPGHQPNVLDNFCELEKDELINDAYLKEIRYGRGPYIINGVPIAPSIEGCCNKDPCFCRSDVIFYDGVPYDQKPFIHGNLRTRSGNVMYFEGKMAGPFNPGKSPLRFGPNKTREKHPQENCFNYSINSYSRHPCCRTSIYGDTVPPYHNSQKLAYTRMGLPHGKTIGYFRFRPERICYDRDPPVSRIEDCCNCQQFEYDASQYAQDECPGTTCC